MGNEHDDVGRGALRLRRSVLIAPGDDEEILGKMAGSNADVCILDWEDGVVPARKAVSRSTTADALTSSWNCVERVVRVNGPDERWFEDDIAAAVATSADAIMIPKIRSVEDVEHAADLITQAEQTTRTAGSVMIWGLIETVESVLDLERIAAGPRMTAMMFGGGDLGADLRLKRIQLGANRTLGPIRYEYLYAMGRFVAAARAAQIDPTNVGFTTYRDLEGTREDAEISAQFGFSGALAISPRQCSILNEVFGPSSEDLAWAQEVLNAVDEAASEERAVVVVDGAMIDGPFVRLARQISDLHELIAGHSR